MQEHSPPPESEACPSEDLLAGFAAGTLQSSARGVIEEHLARCSACFEVVSALAAGPGTPPVGAQELPAQPPPVLGRGTAVGRYIILERIGSGGMGVVYAAYDPELDRKLALKLLPPHGPHGAASPEGRLRLQREARALARLSHPNVVAVYDVGSTAEQVFVAMELVDGQTLGAWRAAASRTWHEVLRCFVEAGRGLAAAHAVGLVHRDFKPDNVLVGRDGKVRVTDFGLARDVAPAPGALPESPEQAAESEKLLVARNVQLRTRTGAQAGTPRYMAPEQWRSAATGPWTDQFSFCVALWESLYGELPFSGDTPAALALEVTAGRLRGEPASRHGVPAQLHAALVRGLEAEPSARHPSMEALLSVLEFDPAKQQRRRALAFMASAAVIVGLAGAGVAWRAYRPAQLCAGGVDRIQTVWGSAQRESVRSGLLASGVPGAERVWELVSRGLDTYTADWATMHREACEATRVHGAQSDELLGLRMVCLDRALRHVATVSEQLARADRATAAKGLHAVHGLPRLAECADAEALLSAPGLPVDPALRQQVVAMREQLAELETLSRLGKMKEALSRAEALTQAAEALPYRPIQAQTLHLEGDLRRRDKQLPKAVELLRKAVLRAEAGREDTTAVKAWTDLALADGSDRTEFAEAQRSIEHAQAALERLGRRDFALEDQLLNARAGIESGQGRWAQALALDEKRVKLIEQSLGPDAPALAVALQNLASSFQGQARIDEAYTAIQRALALQERHWGTETLNFAYALKTLGALERARQHYPEARAAYERALGIFGRISGEDSPHSGLLMTDLAILLSYQKQHEAALDTFLRAVAIVRKNFGPDSEHVANALTNLATTYESLKRYEDALAVSQEALSIRTKKLGPRHALVGNSLVMIGLSQRLLGKPTQALEPLQRAVEIFQSTLPPDHHYQGIALTHLGKTELALGRHAQARATLERAVAVFEKRTDMLDLRANAQFQLAQAQWLAGGPDRVKARQRMLELREKADEPTRAEIDTWLAAHPAPP
jgi:tetratricopeptide (TPR) repeat protein